MSYVALQLVSGPAEEPVTLADAKARIRVTASDRDDEINALIVGARSAGEEFTGRAFVTQTWRASYRGLDCGSRLVLPKPPLISVSQIQYKDSSGVLTTVSTADYEVNTESEPGVIRFITAPSFDTTYENPIQVTFVAGWGAASAVPESIKQAIHFTVAAWSANATGMGGLTDGAKALLHDHRSVAYP